MLFFCRILVIILPGFMLFAKEHALIGVYAVDCASGRVILEKNSSVSMIPASCLKVVTTGAALHLLGKECRFETKLEIDGLVDGEGVLHGNVIVRGGGDPTLGSDRIFGFGSWHKQISDWADALLELGVKKIRGRVIGDATRWEKEMASPGWLWEDIGNAYGSGASALSFHENTYSLVFEPGRAVGEAAEIIRIDPPISMLTFFNEVKTGLKGSGDQACIYGSELSFLRSIRGTIPQGVPEFSICGSIPDPAFYCAELLAMELEEREVCIERAVLSSKRKAVVHTTLSPSIQEIISWTHRSSVNLYAEHLLKKMGEQVFHEGSTLAGIQAVRAFWEKLGIDLEGFQMVDGSGLSRKNLATPKQLVDMLVSLRASETFPLFFESLPEIRKNVRAKSGSMSLVKGYVGYAGEIAFAILINQSLDPEAASETIDAFLEKLY